MIKIPTKYIDPYTFTERDLFLYNLRGEEVGFRISEPGDMESLYTPRLSVQRCHSQNWQDAIGTLERIENLNRFFTLRSFKSLSGRRGGTHVVYAWERQILPFSEEPNGSGSPASRFITGNGVFSCESSLEGFSPFTKEGSFKQKFPGIMWTSEGYYVD